MPSHAQCLADRTAIALSKASMAAESAAEYVLVDEATTSTSGAVLRGQTMQGNVPSASISPSSLWWHRHRPCLISRFGLFCLFLWAVFWVSLSDLRSSALSMAFAVANFWQYNVQSSEHRNQASFLRPAVQFSALKFISWGSASKVPTADSRPGCVFIHGAGSADAAPPSSTDPVYWGSVHLRMPQCAFHRFMHEDTLNVGWEDAGLQARVCTLCGAAAPGDNLSNVLIFTHSMGSLILAGALVSGRCALAASARWFAVASPWHGSRAADRLPEVCAGAPAPLDPALRELARRQRFCDGPNGTPSGAYLSLRTSNLALASLAPTLSRIDGTLCGGSAFGLWSFDSLGLQAMAEFTGFGEDNDGAVPTAGCHTAAAAPTPTSAHYTAAVNHYDVTCRHGDGSWGGDDRKPCSWYAAMANAIFGGADRQELVLQGL